MKLRLPLLLAAAVIAVCSPKAAATDYTWVGANNAVISAASNWTPTSPAATWNVTTNTDKMIFADSTAGTSVAVIDTNIGLGSLSVGAASAFNKMAANDATKSLTLNVGTFDILNTFIIGDATNKLSSLIVDGNQTWNIATGKTLTINTASLSMAGGVKITKTGRGVVNIAGATSNNAYWVFSGDSLEADFNLLNYGGTTVEFVNASGAGYFGTARANAAMNNRYTFTQNIVLTGTGAGGTGAAITMNNGYSESIYVFTGSFTGTGDWTLNAAASIITDHYIFTGDLTGFQGNWAGTGTGRFLEFGDGTTDVSSVTNPLGTGKITTKGNIAFNYGSNANVTNDIVITESSAHATDPLLNGNGILNLANNEVTLSGTITATGQTLSINNARRRGAGPTNTYISTGGIGTILLTNTANSIGTLNVGGGTLAATSIAALGNAATMNITAGATVDYRGASGAMTASTVNANSGEWKVGVSSAATELTWAMSAGTRNGNFTKLGDGTLNVTDGELLANNASITLSGGTLKFTGTGSIGTVNNVYFDGGKLEKATISIGDRAYTVRATKEGAMTGALTLLSGAKIVLEDTASWKQYAGSTLTINGGSIGYTDATASGASFDFTAGGLAIGASGATFNLFEESGVINSFGLAGNLDFSAIGSSKVSLNIYTPSTLLAPNTYTLLTGTNLTQANLDSYFQVTGINLVGTQTGTLSLVGGNVVYIVSGSLYELTWTGADSAIWESSSSGPNNWLKDGTTPAAFMNGLPVTFDETATVKDIVVKGDVFSAEILVKGDQDYSFSADSSGGKITSSSSLIKEGTSALTINMSNDFTGGSTLTEGDLILNAANALGMGAITVNGGTLKLNAENAITGGTLSLTAGNIEINAANALANIGATLGTGVTMTLGATNGLASAGNITFSGGLLKYGTGITDDVSSKLVAAAGNTVNVDINGNTIAWGAVTAAGSYSISDTAATKGKLTLNSTVGNYSLALGTGTTVELAPTVVTSINKLTGTGTLINASPTAAQNGNMFLKDISEFTGKLVVTSAPATGNGYTVIQGVNDATHRLDLELNNTKPTEALILDYAFNNKSLYVRNLSGSGVIRMDYNSATAENLARGLDIEQTQDNTWSGYIAGVDGVRTGAMVIGSEAGNHYTLTLNELATRNGAGTGTAVAGKTLTVNNATLKMAGNGFWNGAIALALAESTLEIARGDTAFNLDKVVSGAGKVVMSGTGSATLSGVNTYSGGTTVSAGTLIAGNTAAFGSGAVTVAGGKLDFGNLAITNTVTVNSGSIGNLNAGQDKSKISVAATGAVSLAGVSSDMINGFSSFGTTTTDGIINDIGSSLNLTASTLTVGSGSMVGSMVDPGVTMVNFTNTSDSLTLATLTLDLSNVSSYFGDGHYFITATNGILAGDILTYSNITLLFDNTIDPNDYYVSAISNGTIQISKVGSLDILTIDGSVANPNKTFTSSTDMDTYSDLIVQGTGVLTVDMATADQTIKLKELRGNSTTAQINSNGTAAGTIMEISATGGNREYKGAITGPASIVKTGAANTTLSGNVNLSGTLDDGSQATGDVTVSQGKLAFTGGLTANDVVVEATSAGLDFGAGTANSINSLTTDGKAVTFGASSTSAIADALTLDNAATLTLGGSSTVTADSLADNTASTITLETGTAAKKTLLSLANGGDIDSALTLNNYAQLQVLAGGATFASNTAVGNNSAIVITGDSVYEGTLTLGNSSQANSTGDSTFEDAVSLGQSSAINATGNATFDETLTMGQGSTVTAGGDATFAKAVTIGQSGGIGSTGGDLTFSDTVSIGQSGQISSKGDASFAKAVTGVDGAMISSEGELTFDSTLSLGASSLVSSDLAATFTGAATLGAGSSMALENDATFDSTLTVGDSSTIAIGGIADFNGLVTAGSGSQITLDDDADFSQGATLTNTLLTLNGDTTVTGAFTTIGGGQIDANGITTFDGAVTLANTLFNANDETTFNDAVTLSSTAFSINDNTTFNGALSGTGALAVNNNGTLSFGTTGTHDLTGMALQIANGGTVDLGTTGNTIKVSDFADSGKLTGTGGTLEVNSANSVLISGTLEGTGNIVSKGANAVLLAGAGSSGYSLDVQNGGLVLGSNSGSPTALNNLSVAGNSYVRVGSSGSSAPAGLNLAGTMTIGSGSIIDLYSAPTASPYFTAAGAINIGSNVTVNLHDDNWGASASGGGDLVITLAHSDTGVTVGGLNLLFTGSYATLFSNLSYSLSANGQDLILKATRLSGSSFSQYAATNNEAVGAGLIWNVVGSRNFDPGSNSQFAKINSAITNARMAGDSAGISRTLGSMAGSAFTAILAAERSALMNHVSTVRNHATKLGVEQEVVNEDMPYFHTWITGNGAYEKLDQSNDEAGFSLNTWGGTFGADIDVTDTFSLGFSFTAEYGKLKAESWDYASGDRDAYYASLYARLQQGKWSHLLAFTGGWSTVDQSRTVNYVGGGSYSTDYDTNATAYNVMYEGAYDFYLNQEKTTILQPLFNASISWLNADGFNERAAHDARLRASDMDMTFGTIGIGARLLGEIGSNVLGRAAMGELRVECVQDIGDTRSTTNVGWVDYPGYVGEVYGAKVGKTGVQAGAGITLPVGNQGAIFGDANIDARSHATSVFGRLGYRYTF